MITAQDLINREKIPATYRQLHFWTERKYLRAAGGEMPGTGIALEFAKDEADIARMMATLVTFGFKVDAAARYARELIESGKSCLIIRIDGDNQLILWRPGTT
jgi:hypothetical protein